MVALVLATAVTYPWDSASGSCAAPGLQLAGSTTESTAARPEVGPGTDLTVHGTRFVDGCDDGGGSATFGCSAEAREPERAQERVSLELVQGDRRWELGPADADAGTGSGGLGEVVWTVRLPAEVRRGPATLEAGDARLPVRIVQGDTVVGEDD